MEAARRFVEKIESVSGPVGEERGYGETLTFSRGEGGGGTIPRKIIKAESFQKFNTSEEFFEGTDDKGKSFWGKFFFQICEP